ncbi:hypothetical protein D3C75_737070 [compost metagenome]
MNQAVAGHELALVDPVPGQLGQKRHAGGRQEGQHKPADGADHQKLPGILHSGLQKQQQSRSDQAGRDKHLAAVAVHADAGQEVARQMGDGVHAQDQSDEGGGSPQRNGIRGENRILGVQIEEGDKHKQVQPYGSFHRLPFLS